MPEAAFEFEAIGTRWQINIFDFPPTQEGGLLLQRVKDRIEVFDKDYSRFRSDSLVTKMAEQGGAYTLPPDAQPMLDLYQKMYGLTDGLVTPLIGQVMIEAGYDANYSLIPKTLHRPPTWDEALEYRFPELKFKKPALLDFGAFGKGYLIDIVAEMLRTSGFQSFCINAGGDIIFESHKKEPLRVGLEHPLNTGQAIGVVNILNQSICGSAGNRRNWGPFHHIINPQTLESPRHILATWAIAPTTLLADALASALFFVPASRLVPEYAFEYVIMYADQSAEVSRNFPGELFSA